MNGVVLYSAVTRATFIRTAKHLLCPSGEGNSQTKWNFSLVTKAMYDLGNQRKVTILFVLQYPLLQGNENISISITLIQKNIS